MRQRKATILIGGIALFISALLLKTVFCWTYKKIAENVLIAMLTSSIVAMPNICVALHFKSAENKRKIDEILSSLHKLLTKKKSFSDRDITVDQISSYRLSVTELASNLSKTILTGGYVTKEIRNLEGAFTISMFALSSSLMELAQQDDTNYEAFAKIADENRCKTIECFEMLCKGLNGE